jgi:toxin YoeB
VKLVFSEDARDDYLYWQRNDPQVLRRINALLKEALRAPQSGIGKPERLRGDLQGYWSRRITHEHRMVYRAEDDRLVIIQLRYHY